MVELLKQGQYVPMPVEQQVMAIFAGAKGHMDDIEVEDVVEFREGLIEYLTSVRPDIGKSIVDAGSISDETAEKLAAAIEDYKVQFKAEG